MIIYLHCNSQKKRTVQILIAMMLSAGFPHSLVKKPAGWELQWNVAFSSPSLGSEQMCRNVVSALYRHRRRRRKAEQLQSDLLRWHRAAEQSRDYVPDGHSGGDPGQADGAARGLQPAHWRGSGVGLMQTCKRYLTMLSDWELRVPYLKAPKVMRMC